MPQKLLFLKQRKGETKEWINAESFQGRCDEVGIFPKNTLFIFPGNASHCRKSFTDPKDGSGLATAARLIGDAGMPTHSLPTTGMYTSHPHDPIDPRTQTAMATLWNAVGLGMNIAIPVRQKESFDYFSDSITLTEEQRKEFEGADLLEPSFWGGTPSAMRPNLKLGDYYLHNINMINHILSLDDDKKQGVLQQYLDSGKIEQACFDAFQAGIQGKSYNPPSSNSPGEEPAPPISIEEDNLKKALTDYFISLAQSGKHFKLSQIEQKIGADESSTILNDCIYYCQHIHDPSVDLSFLTNSMDDQASKKLEELNNKLLKTYEYTKENFVSQKLRTFDNQFSKGLATLIDDIVQIIKWFASRSREYKLAEQGQIPSLIKDIQDHKKRSPGL